MNDEGIRAYLKKKKELRDELKSLDEPFGNIYPGVSSAGADVILFLGSNEYFPDSGGVTKCGVGSGTGETRDITRLSRRLEDLGLVVELELDRTGVDRRTKKVRLTEKGKDLYRRMINEIS